MKRASWLSSAPWFPCLSYFDESLQISANNGMENKFLTAEVPQLELKNLESVATKVSPYLSLGSLAFPYPLAI